MAGLSRRPFGRALLLLLGGAGRAPVPWEQSGTASWYGEPHHGRRTASGERFDMAAMTAAHRTLPFGSLVEVLDLSTGRSVVVRVNDRGPFTRGRVIDLSRGAALALGMAARGTAPVRLGLVRR